MGPTPERRLLYAAIVAWLAVAVLSILLGPPLGHDEAAFGVAARGDAPAWVYRSAGVIWEAKVGVTLGGAAWQLRILPALLGTSVLVGAYAVGRAAFSERTGAWAAAVLAGMHPLALRSAELIGDLPATGAALAGIAIVLAELGRSDGPRWRLVACAPAFAAAFYLRYGSAPLIAIVAGAALLVWWRALLRRPLPVLATLALFALLLVPHLAQSIAVTGRPLGILEVSSHMPRRAFVGEGLVTYLTTNPFRFYGALVTPAIIAGVVALVRPPPKWRATAFLGLVALGQVLALGLESHAQPRYVFVAVGLLVVLGVERAQHLQAPRLARFTLPCVLLAWLGVVVAVPLYSDFLADARAPIVAGAEAVRADAAGRPCLVVAKSVPQLMWYSGCREHLLRALDDVPPWEVPAYVIAWPRAQISIEAVLDAQPGTPRPVAAADPRVEVWAVSPPEPRPR